MNQGILDFYAAPGPLSTLPDHPALAAVPTDFAALRATVQGLLVHRDWVEAYGIEPKDARLSEQHLRTTAEILERAFEISDAPVTQARPPIDRVVSICRDFSLVHVALLRSQGVPARMRCGFSNYFDRSKWYDHWITERWTGERWIREDPQIDDLQRKLISLDIDPYDQPPGHFLTGSEAWAATRAGELDPQLFGIADMWGGAFIAGNVLLDLGCLNKVELLPWDSSWNLVNGPYDPVPPESIPLFDDLAKLVNTDDADAIRARYETDDQVRIKPDLVSWQDGQMVPVHLDL